MQALSDHVPWKYKLATHRPTKTELPMVDLVWEAASQAHPTHTNTQHILSRNLQNITHSTSMFVECNSTHKQRVPGLRAHAVMRAGLTQPIHESKLRELRKSQNQTSGNLNNYKLGWLGSETGFFGATERGTHALREDNARPWGRHPKIEAPSPNRFDIDSARADSGEKSPIRGRWRQRSRASSASENSPNPGIPNMHADPGSTNMIEFAVVRGPLVLAFPQPASQARQR